jgi:uncharacterized repeat protein (TIGR03943 family)
MNGGGMNKETQSIVVALLGGLLLSITLSGRFTSYVRPGFAPLLLIGGGILVLVGVLSLVLAIRADLAADRAQKVAAAGIAAAPALDASPDDAADAHGHDHSAAKAPWLILLPVLVLLLVAPPALGADAVARNASSQGLAGYDVVAQEPAGSKDGAGASPGGYKFNDGSGSATDSTGSHRTMHFPPLEGTDPSMTIKDLVLRALYDADNSVQDKAVTVTGFIAPAGDGYSGGYTIARMVISCCAADANPMQLHVAGDAPLPSNTWVNAVVTVVPDTATLENGYVPTITLSSMTTTNQPDDPYEH